MKLQSGKWNPGIAAVRSIVISAVIIIHGIAVFHPEGIWLVRMSQKENLSAWIVGAFLAIFSPFWMSILFMLSGSLSAKSLERQNKGNYLRSRAQRLLIPCLLYAIILGPLTRLISVNLTSPETNPLSANLASQINPALLPLRLDSLWFCVTLFIFAVIISQLSNSKIFRKFQRFIAKLMNSSQRVLPCAVTTIWIALTAFFGYSLKLFGGSIYVAPVNNFLAMIGLVHYVGHLEWIATDFSVLFFSFLVLDLSEKIRLYSREKFILACAWLLLAVAITSNAVHGGLFDEVLRCIYISASLYIVSIVIKNYKQKQSDFFFGKASDCSYGALVFHALIISVIAGIVGYLGIPSQSGVVVVAVAGLVFSYGCAFLLRRNKYVAKII